MRLCKRCDKTYRTFAKFGRVCEDCKKPMRIPTKSGNSKTY